MRRALLCLPLLLAGCAGLDVHRADLQLAPGQIAEVNLALQQGDTVRWDWTASETLHFNVHSHSGGGMVEHVTRQAARDQGSFTAPAAGSYSLFWQPASPTPVVLTYSITGAGKLESTLP